MNKRRKCAWCEWREPEPDSPLCKECIKPPIGIGKDKLTYLK